jgi:hypothetical protein
MENKAPVTVVEMETFAAAARKCQLTEAEFIEIADYLSLNPEAGDLIKGTRGLRKVRFARPGMGKSGGYRTVHFFMDHDSPLFLFTVYSKSQKENISDEDKKKMRSLVAELKKESKPKKS